MGGGMILLSRATKKSQGNTRNSLIESKLKPRVQLRITFFTCLSFTSMSKQHKNRVSSTQAFFFQFVCVAHKANKKKVMQCMARCFFTASIRALRLSPFCHLLHLYNNQYKIITQLTLPTVVMAVIYFFSVNNF